MGKGYWTQSGYVSIRNIVQYDTHVASCTYDSCRNARTYNICAKMHVRIHVKRLLLLYDFNEA